MVFKNFFLLTKWQIFLLIIFLLASSLPNNQIYGPCSNCHGFPVPFWADHYKIEVGYAVLLAVAAVINFLFWNIVAGLIIFIRLRAHR